MKILFATGGTGGHINPALAAAGEIKKQYPDAEILFVGTKEKWKHVLYLLRDMLLRLLK